MKMKQGFTLVELIMVILIIGILAALAFPQFSKTKEHAIGKEAIVNLKLIAAAEKIYRMEASAYYPIPAGSESNITNINNYLRLSIPLGATRNWDYAVTSTGSPPSSFTAYGDRLGSGAYLDCQYSINQSQEDPIPDASCP